MTSYKLGLKISGYKWMCKFVERDKETEMSNIFRHRQRWWVQRANKQVWGMTFSLFARGELEDTAILGEESRDNSREGFISI